MTSVALLTAQGDVIAQASRVAPRAASAAASDLLERLLSQSGHTLDDATGFVADVGPGSFTGVRVGVVMAKMLGVVHGQPVAGISAKDLISPISTVVFPSKRGEWFVFAPDGSVERSADLPSGDFVGFGPGVDPETYPEAWRAGQVLGHLHWTDAVSLLPDYHLAPSISVPKTRMGGKV